MQVQTLLERIGTGPTHIWMLLALSLIQIINGYKIVMISLISPHLKNQWGLEQNVKNIPLAFYCGIITGSLLAVSLANMFGRKLTLFFGQFIQIVGSLAMVYCNKFLPFLMVLIVAGTGFGISLIMANTLCTEQMPQKYRGRALLFISFISILGKFFAIFAVYMFEIENWRVPEAYLAGCGGVVSVLILIKVPESLRAMLIKGDYQQSQKIFVKLLKQQKKPQITQPQKKLLKQLSQNKYTKYTNRTQFQQIFYRNKIQTTLTLSISWFVINFMFYGQLFIMPFISENKESSAPLQLAQMVSGEIPSILLTFNMIQREKFGRKNSLVIFFCITGVLNYGLIYAENVFLISISRLTMKSIHQILYPFTTESYSTPLRTSGLAFCAGIGRLGSIVMPIIVYTLFKMGSHFVFVSFFVASLLGLFAIMGTQETLHHSLDDFDKEMKPMLQKQEIQKEKCQQNQEEGIK